MKKLNLGCGYVQPSNWTNADKVDYGQTYIEDVLEGLSFHDETFDFVLMNHTLQMFKYDELPIVLKEVRRVMKEGTTLRILVPDLQVAVANYIFAKMGKNTNGLGRSYYPISDDLERTSSGKFARYVFWHGDTRCAFDKFSLRDLLERNSFKTIEFGKYGECELDSRQAESLVMTCKK